MEHLRPQLSEKENLKGNLRSQFHEKNEWEPI